MENREIKFRAWNGKEMIYPSIIGIAPYENFAWPHSRSYIHNCEDWDFTEGLIQEPILMQYTGLKDKHGVEIYEKSTAKCIIMLDFGFAGKHPREVEGVIEYEKQAAAFWFKYIDRDGKKRYKELKATFSDGEVYQCDFIEVIGNTFDNPELIK